MERVEIAVIPQIARDLMDTQLAHDLPINFTAGWAIQGLTRMIVEFEKRDELLWEWLKARCIDAYGEQSGTTSEG